jgi:hypothetical protein
MLLENDSRLFNSMLPKRNPAVSHLWDQGLPHAFSYIYTQRRSGQRVETIQNASADADWNEVIDKYYAFAAIQLNSPSL